MTGSPQPAVAGSKLQRLLGFLESDPSNSNLLTETAAAAFDANEAELAQSLITRAAVLGPLPPQLLNLRALGALAQERFADAASDLQALLDLGENHPALRFNLAWSLTGMNRFEEADRFLDPEAVAISRRGPSLKIHILHHLDKYDDALALGAILAERYPHDEALMGALATLAMDAERDDLARVYAAQAGANPEGFAARGLFALESDDFIAATSMFDEAIIGQPKNPRAWVGKGLALLSTAKAEDAARAIDHGAEIFGDHLGSWVAAAWAHFIAGNTVQARERFERVTAIDPTFAEGHGGLAVMDVMAGNLVAAQRNCDVALRLDRTSMGGALAKSLLLEAAGDTEAAERIRTAALNAPIGPGGKTLAQTLASSASGLLKQ